jgi:glycosyltransferase involved in cell wall biosynthesis
MTMTKHYVVFTRNTFTQPAAHLVWAANSANGAANVGYPSVLVHLDRDRQALNPVRWIAPPAPQAPTPALVKSYNLQTNLKVAPLPMPWPIDSWNSKWTNSSTIVCKYYLPRHVLQFAKIVHSRDWNFVKAAIRNGIPAIYEHHHYEKKQFEPELVHNPLLQLAVTVADNIGQSMIDSGMPAEKIVKLHSGFNQCFLSRHPEAAAAWREKLLSEKQHLVVYSGGLYRFKGVDLLIEVAKMLPQIQFAFAGGNPEQVQAYRQLAVEQQANNVVFLGYVTHDQLGSLLQAADILAHPHCSGSAATFTSPLKFFEYMASGTPMVATEIPPLMEFKASDVVAGWCEPDQPMQFADRLQQVLQSHPRRPEGYDHSIRFASQFSWESRAKNLFSHVEEAMRPELLST